MTAGSPSILRTPGVLAQRLDDEIVLLDAERGHYFALNATGARIWEWIGEEGAAVPALVQRLVEAYDVAPPEAERDVLELLRQLEAQGLIERRGPGAAR
ncbi:MAG TPA: PqqD family protein [Thermoanaerobaculia bacterium]|nr:PqqD family protein [Thermoanaerobaculia bacterium]